MTSAKRMSIVTQRLGQRRVDCLQGRPPRGKFNTHYVPTRQGRVWFQSVSLARRRCNFRVIRRADEPAANQRVRALLALGLRGESLRRREPLRGGSCQSRLRSVTCIQNRYAMRAWIDCPGLESSPDAGAIRRHQPADSATHDDYFRLQQVNHIAKPDGQMAGGLFQNLLCQFIAAACGFVYGLRGYVGNISASHFQDLRMVVAALAEQAARACEIAVPEAYISTHPRLPQPHSGPLKLMLMWPPSQPPPARP